jgi:hypothetical protein
MVAKAITLLFNLVPESSILACRFLRVTTPAKPLMVVTIPEQFLIPIVGFDVINHYCRNYTTLLFALNA